jgi:hypothetical protein
MSVAVDLAKRSLQQLSQSQGESQRSKRFHIQVSLLHREDPEHVSPLPV